MADSVPPLIDLPPAESNVQRYPNLARRQHVSQPRMEYRHRTKPRNVAKPTPAESALQAARRAENKKKHQDALEAASKRVWAIAEEVAAELGNHPPAYYFTLLLQQSKIPDSARKTNKWNAFLSKEVAAINAEREKNGEARERSANYVGTLSKKWTAMTSDEQDEAVADYVKKLEERRENKQFAPHNVSINSFHDSRATLEKVERELKALAQRTGDQVLMSVVRGSQDDFLAPHTFSTDERLEDFFQLTFGMEFGRWTGRLESFVLTGLLGAKKSAFQELMDLKNKIATLIFQKLEYAARPLIVKKMNYERFDDAITRKYALVIDNWPLAVFQAPGKFNTMVELRTLHNAWHSGHARFRRLSSDELAEWERQRASHGSQGAAAPESTTHEGDDPAPVDGASSTTGSRRSFETAFPASETPTDAPAKKVRKKRKDAGKKKGPNVRTTGRPAPEAC